MAIVRFSCAQRMCLVGLFEFMHMPFGLSGAVQTFQRMTDLVLDDLAFVFLYLDGILVASL